MSVWVEELSNSIYLHKTYSIGTLMTFFISVDFTEKGIKVKLISLMKFHYSRGMLQDFTADVNTHTFWFTARLAACVTQYVERGESVSGVCVSDSGDLMHSQQLI